MLVHEMRQVLDEVNYDGWHFIIGGVVNAPAGLYLQVEFPAYDAVTGEATQQRGRKWQLSEYMTKSELVQTALAAVLYATEHEVRESFKYKGQPIFKPHYDVDDLVELSQNSVDVREPVA